MVRTVASGKRPLERKMEDGQMGRAQDGVQDVRQFFHDDPGTDRSARQEDYLPTPRLESLAACVL